MDTLRLELVIGFALLVLVGVPTLVVRLLERSKKTPSSGPPLTVKKDANAERSCPYCKDAIAPDAVHIECATCHTKHHATCFEENHGCAVFGCKERRGVGRAERAS